MEDRPTPLALPSSLPYPLTVTRLLAPPGTLLTRGSPLLEYKFTSDTSRNALSRQSQNAPKQEGDEDARENDMVGSWESPIQGQLSQWATWVLPGTVIERIHAGKDMVFILQPCTHPVQLHGMCGVCGADLTTDDYLSRPADESLAGLSNQGFEMSHDSLGVTVSTNAKRLENQARETLLHERKLSLIVDLDQTIIHTTVDPTVGEWMTEIDKGRNAEVKLSDSTTPPGSPSSTTSPMKKKNPNAEALEDVARFQLSDDLPSGYNPTAKSTPGHERWYYTKPRPGLESFLSQMNKKYEMHVYTMGTRTYADAICKVVDPSGQFFGGRIISRDESGSFNSKNLQRLFPTDQSMVVVIDDRADVWGDIPNLVKVVPYDFFLGIGDINSSFLPPNPNKAVPAAPGSSPESDPSKPAENDLDESSVRAVQTKLLDQLSEDRPLAKLQEQLDSDAAKETDTPDKPTGQSTEDDNAEKKSTTPPGSPGNPRNPLLNPHDDELERIAGILSRVHAIFYDAYDSRKDRSPSAPLPLGCDVEIIIPDIKSTVLEGCILVFTGVIARHERPENSPIFAQAEAFGAQPVVELSPDVTYCVTAVEGTEKAILARRMGIPVLWVGWFHRCVALWERVDEHDWLVNPPRDVSNNGVLTRPTSGDATPATGGSLGLQIAGAGNSARGPNKGWDEAYQKELEELLNGSSDNSDDSDDDSDAGSVATSLVSDTRSRAGSPLKSALASLGGSPPGTPRKRVRYADEESLPLESVKELPQSDSPPKKKKKPLLLGPPREDDHIPEANRLEWKGQSIDDEPAESDGPDHDTEVSSLETDGEEDHDDQTASSDLGNEDDDYFARMLADSMDG